MHKKDDGSAWTWRDGLALLLAAAICWLAVLGAGVVLQFVGRWVGVQ